MHQRTSSVLWSTNWLWHQKLALQSTGQALNWISINLPSEFWPYNVKPTPTENNYSLLTWKQNFQLGETLPFPNCATATCDNQHRRLPSKDIYAKFSSLLVLPCGWITVLYQQPQVARQTYTLLAWEFFEVKKRWFWSPCNWVSKNVNFAEMTITIFQIVTTKVSSILDGHL